MDEDQEDKIGRVGGRLRGSLDSMCRDGLKLIGTEHDGQGA